MARYTSPYGDYLQRTREVELLVSKAKALERKNAVGNGFEIATLCRASIVLLSSHLEGYVKDLGELTASRIVSRSVPRSRLDDRFFYHLSKSHFEKLRETADPAKLAKQHFAFLSQDAQLWDRTGPFPTPLPYDRFAKGFATPSVDKIYKFLGRFGVVGIRGLMQAHLRHDYVATITMIDNIVNTRNNIAHGDAVLTKTPTDVTEMFNYAKAFIRSTDVVFADWCSANLCTIR